MHVPYVYFVTCVMSFAYVALNLQKYLPILQQCFNFVTILLNEIDYQLYNMVCIGRQLVKCIYYI